MNYIVYFCILTSISPEDGEKEEKEEDARKDRSTEALLTASTSQATGAEMAADRFEKVDGVTERVEAFDRSVKKSVTWNSTVEENVLNESKAEQLKRFLDGEDDKLLEAATKPMGLFLDFKSSKLPKGNDDRDGIDADSLDGDEDHNDVLNADGVDITSKLICKLFLV